MVLLEDTIACRFIKNSAYLLIIILLSVACKEKKSSSELIEEHLPFYNNAQFDASWIDEGDSGYASIHTIDTFHLTNQLGHTITKDSLDNHIYVANFFFTTCPGICPKMVNNLQSLQDSFINNPQIKLVSFSVMPWIDNVAKLNEYGKMHQINPNKWYLLTGDKERIYHLGRHAYFAEKSIGLQKDSSEFLHTESMLLIDKKARIRGIYNATQKLDIERVSEDIRVLLKE
jgi:protein SCO1/2